MNSLPTLWNPLGAEPFAVQGIAVDTAVFDISATLTAVTKYPQGSTSLIALLGGDNVPATFKSHLLGFDTGAAPSASPLKWTTSAVVHHPATPAAAASDRLFDLKVATAEIAMHLERPWRSGFFSQLDYLLDEESWDISDALPSPASFRTFLRLIVELGRPKRPSLSCSDDGDIIATWIRTEDRLTIECRPDDKLRWVLVRRIAKDFESAAGTCKLENLMSRLAPYNPEIWFYADDEHSGPRRPVASRQGEASGARSGHA